MLGYRGQQRVDRLFLDIVRRIPGYPVGLAMLGESDIDLALEPGQEIDDRLQALLASKAVFIGNDVLKRKTEFWIDTNVGGADTGFFFEFAQGTLQFRLTRVDVPLGKIP